MAQSQSGKWVSSVGSTGGGKNYRSRRPMNFYGVIALIVVLGLASIVWARYEYRNSAPAAASTSLPPLVNTTVFSGLGIDVCGTLQPSLPASTKTTGALVIGADGVVKVAPTTKAEAGIHANVQAMAAGYTGMEATSSTLKVPATSTASAVDLKNGDACPSGTRDAGQKGVVVVSHWSSFASKSPTLSNNPAAIRLTGNSLVTLAFLPSGSKPQKPSQTTINAMLTAAQSGSTTPTTAGTTGTATTVPATTTTSAATTTTGK